MNPYPERHNWWYRSPEELGTVIQVTKDCRKATMSRTPDERLDQNPTAEVQGLGRDIGNSPSIREVSRSRSDGSSSRIRESASTLEQSPAQVAQMLLQSRQLANQQEVQATTGAGVSVINTPANHSSLTNMGTVPVERRTASRTASSFGTTATGASGQSGMLSEPRASTRQPTNSLGTQRVPFQGVGMNQRPEDLPQEDFMASMDFNVGGEEKDDDDINDPEIEMNIGARGTRTRSNNVEVPIVARSGAEDFATSSQQREGVMTHVGGISSGQQASGTYRPRPESRMPMERMAIGNGFSPVTDITGDGVVGGTYQRQGELQRASPSVAPATTGGISDSQLQQLDREMQAESLQLKREEFKIKLGIQRGADHKYREELAKKNLKHLTGTALHLGGKLIANVGASRSTYDLTEWISDIRQSAIDLNVLNREDFLRTVKQLVHDQDGAHEGKKHQCQPHGRGRIHSGKDPKPTDFLRRWEAARATNAVKQLKEKLDKAYHVQELIAPEKRGPEWEAVDYTPLFDQMMDVMQVDKNDIRMVHHKTLYHHDNALDLKSIRRQECPAGKVLSREAWDLMVEQARKRARTISKHVGGTYESPQEQIQMAQTAQELAKWALQRQSVPEMQTFMAENGVTLETLTKLALTPLVESGPQNLVHEDGPHGYVHSFYEICVPDAVKKFLIRNEKLPKEMSDLTMGHLKKAVEHFCGTGQAAVTETLYLLEQKTVKNQKSGHPDVGKSKGSPGQKKRGRENGRDIRPVVAIQQEQFTYRAGKCLGVHGQGLSLAKKLNCDRWQTGIQWTFAKDGSHCCSDYQKHTQAHLVNGKPLPGRDGAQ